MKDSTVVVDVSRPHYWTPAFLPLYLGLTQASKERTLTDDERAVCKWLSFGLARNVFNGMM